MTYDKECSAGSQKIEAAKKFITEVLNAQKYSIKDIVSEIYNIYQDYLISEEEEVKLYKIADPQDLYNSVSEYWYSGEHGCQELYKIFKEV